MSSSSSASSSVTHRRHVTGVPTRCWCGRKVITYCSQTNENPYRRFYRCEIALQRKMEEHLFKWVDEALLDETRMVDAKVMSLLDEVKELRKEMVANFEVQKKQVRDMEEEMNGKMKKEVKEKIKEAMMMANATIQEMAKKSMERVVVSLLVVGAVGWLGGKFLMR